MTACANRPDDDTLRRLYTDESNTVAQMASMYGCGTTTMGGWLKCANVDVMHRRRHNKVCRVCGDGLTDANWYSSARILSSYICKHCAGIVNRKWVKNNPENARMAAERSNRKRGRVSIHENKTCGGFLGVHVAEKVLCDVFKDVTLMPYNNPGYDFICNKGKKIDVKSACARFRHRNSVSWEFSIDKNYIADFFLCLAFDDRESLTPLYLWLIPSHVVCHLGVAAISKSKIYKWDEYRLNIDKVVLCCDTMRGE